MVRDNDIFGGFHLTGAEHTVIAGSLFAGFSARWARYFAGALI
jgi:hypothetical protein